MKESSKTKVIVFLSILIVALIAACVYFAVDRKPNDTNQSNTSLEKDDHIQEEELVMNDIEKEYFMNHIINELDKNPSTGEPFKTEDLTSAEKLKIAFTLLDHHDQTVSYDTLSHAFKKVFGNKYALEPVDFECPGHNNSGLYYKYDRNTKHYYVDATCPFEPGIVDIVNRFEEGKVIKKNGKIISAVVKMRKSFSTVTSGTSGPSAILVRYGTINNAHQMQNAADDFTKSDPQLLSPTDDYIIVAMEKHLSEYPVHTYTFNYDGDTWYLKSLSID